jgi:thiamine-phosphate pyrophosphorylase
LIPDLRLIVITDRGLAGDAGVAAVVRACLQAGAPAVQLRDKAATARELFEQATLLRGLTREFRALLFVNDRVDVALAAAADGVHLGPEDLPLELARRIAPAPFLIGYSADSPATARAAQAAGASYIGCGAVFATSTKQEARGERIGPDRVGAVAAAVDVPVVGIGGIDAENADQVAAAGAAGVAVVSALMRAVDPAAETRRLLAAFRRPG